LLSFKEL